MFRPTLLSATLLLSACFPADPTTSALEDLVTDIGEAPAGSETIYARLEAMDALAEQQQTLIDTLTDRIETLEDVEGGADCSCDLTGVQSDITELNTTLGDIDSYTGDPLIGVIEGIVSELDPQQPSSLAALAQATQTTLETTNQTLAQHGTDISGIKTRIDFDNATPLASRVSLLSSNSTSLATTLGDHTTSIATNAGAINDNTVNIVTNTDSIGDNVGDIATNTDSIGDNAGDIATNTDSIGDNAGDIAANTSAIQQNASDISGSAGWISQDMPISVSPNGTSLYDALAQLDGMLIANDATVTIQLANGDYPMTEPVVVSHPNADRIAIVGNTDNYNSVRLLFGETDGIVIQPGTHLGRLAGLHIAGLDTDETAGIRASRGGSVLVEDTLVRDFRIGISAEWGGVALADGVDIESCYQGFLASRTGAISAQSSTSTDTVGGGYVAAYAAFIDAELSGASDGETGYVAIYDSAINAARSEADNHTQSGYSAAHFSYVYAASSTISNAQNSITGYRADDFSFVTARAATVSNTDRPANADGMAFVDTRDWNSTNNGNGNAPLPARGTIDNGNAYSR